MEAGAGSCAACTSPTTETYLRTADVPVVVQTSGDMGKDIDGLLGQPYLSRFQVSIQPDRWSIGPRRTQQEDVRERKAEKQKGHT